MAYVARLVPGLQYPRCIRESIGVSTFQTKKAGVVPCVVFWCFGAAKQSKRGSRIDARVDVFLDAAYQQVFELCLRHDAFGIRLDRV